MNLFEILKQFKTIEPDPAFKEISKRAILAQTPKESWSTRKAVLAFFETGIAVALSVFFILIVTGFFPTSSYVSPVQLSAINPESLRAEAQAIDIQIQLANVSYAEAATSSTNLPQAIAKSTVKRPSAAAQSLSVATSTTEAATSSTSAPTSSAVSVDQALEELTQ